MFIPFAEWKPDSPDLGDDAITITNVIPMEDHYIPMPTFNGYSLNNLTYRAQGAFAARDIDGTIYNFAGDAQNLYRLSSSSYSNISRVAGGIYTTGSDEQWNFTQFGRNVYATNFNDVIQVYTMGSSTNFAALAGSPPHARYLGVVGNDFLMLGNLDIGTYTVQWSPQGNPAGTWGTDPATLADKQDLASEWGWIKGVVGGWYGTIFQEHAITRAQFAGSPLGFEFFRVEENKGTFIPGSICKIGGGIFYRGFDGFYIFDGQQSIPIGVNRVDRFFSDDFDNNYPDRVRTVCDQTKMLVYMSYPSSNNDAGACDRMLIYNYSPTAQKKWTLIDLLPDSLTGIECLHSFLSEGYTLDSLDTLSGSIDALVASLDSESYTGGVYSLGAFSIAAELGLFNSGALTSYLTTGEFQPVPMSRSQITRVRPIIDTQTTAPSMSLDWYYRVTQQASPTHSGAFGQLSATGDFVPRVNGHYHRGKISMIGAFDKAMGLEILEVTSTGER